MQNQTGEKKEQFVVMAKPVGSACNLRCEYCYYLGKGTGTQKIDAMSDDTLEKFIKNYMKSSKGPVISFTWHGGEPALTGLDFYEKAVALEKKYLEDGFTVWNSLQTNGTLLDEKWCEFLKKESFDVGLSIDGTSWIHDTYRKDFAGNGTYDKVYKAAQMLKKYSVMPDLMCTVTSDTAKEPIAVYIAIRNLGTGWIQFIPIVRRDENGVVTKDSVTPLEYGNFLCKIFDYWKMNDIGKTDVQLFAESASVISGHSASLCTMAKECGKALIVERNGDVYSCDHFVDKEHLLGNVEKDILSELLTSPLQQKFGKDKSDTAPEKCKNCKFFDLCGGGCPKDRFLKTEDGEIYYLCDGIKRFYEHSYDSMVKILSLRKNGLSAEMIMNEMRAIERKKWQNVQRNDPCPCGSGLKAKNCCWNIKP